MRLNNRMLICLLILLVLRTVGAQTNILPQDHQPYDYAKSLGWVSDPDNAYSLCNGYYRSYPIPYKLNPLVKSQTHNYDIVADHATYSTKGTSILRGHVRITQPDKELKTGLAYLHRNKKTGKIENIDLYHGVRLFTPGDLLVGRYGHMNVKKNTIQLHNTAYRNLADNQKQRVKPTVTVTNPNTHEVEKRNYSMNYWGHAKTTNQTKPHVYQFKNATYTTCPPTKTCAWHLHATTVTLNKKTNVGEAWNSVLRVKNVPVFWFPYISFPLDHKRKTGFLTPTYGVSDSSGTIFSLPFYWNIAPNYDATITGSYLSKRGYMLSPLFRFLTPTSEGTMKFRFLPNDKEFRDFKKNAQTNPKYANQPEGLKRLGEDSNNRYQLRVIDSTTFSPHWQASVDYSRDSDDYVEEDFSSGLTNNSNNQLLQKGQVEYNSLHWNFLGLLQSYQTLHPIDQSRVSNQYARLPELQLGASYPDFSHGLDFSFNLDDTQFEKSRAPDTTTKPVLGNRLTANPSFDYPVIRPYGYLTSRLQLHATAYKLSQEGNLPEQTGVVIPTFDLHGGLYFDRDFSWFGTAFKETLEPELYYLYTPYHNQNELPVFDTSTQPFDYNFMFQDNRFTGVDRIGDANQVTYAVTTRFINEETGNEKGSISIGEIYYFNNRRVVLCSGHNCGQSSNLDKRHFSPVAGQANYNINSTWKLNGGLTWNPYAHQFSHQVLGVTFDHQKAPIINLNYNYVKSGGLISGQPKGSNTSVLKQLNIAGEWLIKRRWHVLGKWGYSWSGNSAKDHANAYLAGVQYDSCCWAVRLIGSRTFQSVSNTGQNQFNDAFYLQFDLKGLGSVGNADPSSLVSSIPGYKNTFDEAVIGS